MIISPEQYTLADMLRGAGYATGAVGKWHLGLGETARQDWNGVIAPGLSDIGFDYSFIMAATGDRVPCVYIENQRVVGLDPADPISVSYAEPFEGEPTGRDNPELLVMTPSHGHDQTIVNGISRIGYMKGGKAALWKDDRIADRITDKAVEFIARNREHPFFLYFGTNDIHVPRVPHARFARQERHGAARRRDSLFRLLSGPCDAYAGQSGHRGQYAADRQQRQRTVVDDGYNDRAVELLGDHRPWGDFRGGKYSAFEAGTRVPMLVRWRGHVPAGAVSDALLSHIDIFASLGALCGGEIPEGAAPDSRNHLSALLGGGPDREYVVEQNLNNTLSIIVDGWKYIEPSNKMRINRQTDTELGNDPMRQLYNLREDVGERHNLAGRYPAKADSLHNKLENIKRR